MMIRTRTVLAAILVVGATAGLISAGFSIARSNAPEPVQVAQVEALTDVPASPSTVFRIGALGTVEPRGGNIAIVPPVGGIVAEVLVAPGDMVDAGAPLFRLDDRLAAARVAELTQAVASAEATLADAEANVPSLEADVGIARAVVTAAEAQRDEAAQDVATAEQLVGSNGVTRRELERRLSTLRIAEAQLAEAQARLDRAEAELSRSDPAQDGSRLMPLVSALDDAEATLETAIIERDMLTVMSPIDAMVLDVDLMPGEYAAPGSTAASVTIGAAGILEVRVEIEEADVPMFRDDAGAVALVRGGDGTEIPLTLVRREPQLRPKTMLTGEGAERIDTRVLEVVFALPVGADSVVPGQLVDVLIDAEMGGV